jgi:glucose-1-phosphatase
LNPQEIENIIFDLGGVVINLDIDATFRKFTSLFNKEVTSEIFTKHHSNQVFRDFEIGKIDDATFRDYIRELAGFHISDDLIDDAWNAMLQDIPGERMEWIYEATRNYNCVVLSNTNSIHIHHFEQKFEQTSNYGLPGDLFHDLFYSFDIGKRKPDADAFEYVLEKTGFDPTKTVLFDDLKENLDTAKSLGLRTVYVERNDLRRAQLPNGRIK